RRDTGRAPGTRWVADTGGNCAHRRGIWRSADADRQRLLALPNYGDTGFAAVAIHGRGFLEAACLLCIGAQSGAGRYGGAVAGLPGRGAAPREAGVIGDTGGRVDARAAQSGFGGQACCFATARKPEAAAGAESAVGGEAEDATSIGVHAQSVGPRGSELLRARIEHSGTVGRGRGDVRVAAGGRSRKRIHDWASAGGDW